MINTRKILPLPYVPTYCIVTNSSPLGLSAPAWTQLTFDTLVKSNGINYDTVNNRFNISENGVYRVGIVGVFTHNVSGVRMLGVSFVPGFSSPIEYNSFIAAASLLPFPLYQQFIGIYSLVSGDIVSPYAYSDTGGINLELASGYSPKFYIEKVS